MILSYLDDIFKLSHAFVKKDYSGIRDLVLSQKEQLNFRYEEDGEVWGYRITKNQPVSEIYGFNAYVVRFYFSKIDTLHNPHQEEVMEKMFEVLAREMEVYKGYYNVRLPAHVVDVVKAFGKKMTGGIFCGGTVEQVVSGKRAPIPEREGLVTFFADKEYVDKYRKELLDLTYASFKSYQGQYHLSPVTCDKAGVIYERWIQSYFDHYEDNRIIIAQYNGEPVGIVTIGEDENLVEAQIGAVTAKYRELGAYRTIIASLINYGLDQGKCFATSTQFDNFIVQGVWNSLGMKPCFSFYNYHFDRR